MTKASIYILPPLARVFTAGTLPLAYEAPSPNIFSLTTDAFTTNGKLPPGLISICRWSLFLAPLKFTRIYYNFRLFFYFEWYFLKWLNLELLLLAGIRRRFVFCVGFGEIIERIFLMGWSILTFLVIVKRDARSFFLFTRLKTFPN